MKRLTFFFISILSLGLVAFSSCEQDHHTPSDEPPHEEPLPDKDTIPNNDSIPEVITPEDNYMLKGDKLVEFKSVLVENYGDYIHFFVSPQEGITEINEDILTDSHYLSAIIMPSFIGECIDLMTEVSKFTINSTMEELPFGSIAPEQTDAIKNGKLFICRADDLFSLQIEMTMADDTYVVIFASTTVEDSKIDINSNSYNFNGEEKPIRASFHGTEDGISALHFTSGAIDYYDELGIATSYISVYCPESSYTGEVIGIATHDTELAITYTDNYTEEVFYIESGNTGSPEDNIRITRDPDNEYGFKVYMDVTFPENGKRLVLDYDGVCKDFSSKPAPESELTYNGEVSTLNSLVIDMTDGELCRIYLSGASGITTVEDMSANGPLVIIFPKEAIVEPFDAIVGFSMYKDGEASISYNGQTYTYENSFGTIETSFADGIYSISFDNWDNLTGFYKGPGTLIE